MDLITLLLAATLAIGAGSTIPETPDTGATTSAETSASDTDEARSNIVDIGATSQ